ncbi:MAG: hypothetical protein ICV78_20745 [Tolypothrix sp. Co-bin9]|nr:hypothetical protein [Tolypothrix sp. Co-bin9]
MCIVLDYIEKYPLRTKQILGISYEQLRSLTESSIIKHEDFSNSITKITTKKRCLQ